MERTVETLVELTHVKEKLTPRRTRRIAFRYH